MVFSSLVFLYIFLPITLLLYYVVPGKVRNVILFICSLIFYAWGEPVYVLGMLASIVVNYVFALLLHKHKSKLLLALNIILNLSYLGFFKYTNFAIGTFNRLFGLDVSLMDIALPIGISFYTFQALSYTIDVYRGTVKANKNILEFGTYLTMFPQLIAGPIVRYKTVAYELRNRHETLNDFADGAVRFSTGLAKKIIIADGVGKVWDGIKLGSVENLTVSTVWLGMLLFTLQIYFDFSGYSDMAIGLGRMFGFHFDENFSFPYRSTSITEFWRRWHISLSTWFKEYVYIPLGGNRKGLLRQIINIFIVWMLTGLWHGAAWNFVAWGVYYGILLIIEKVFLKKILDKLPAFISWIYTAIIVVVGWGIFSYSDIKWGLRQAFIKGVLLSSEYGWYNDYTIYIISQNIILIIAAVIIASGVFTWIKDRFLYKYKAAYRVLSAVYIGAIFIVVTVMMVADSYSPFLYFRF